MAISDTITSMEGHISDDYQGLVNLGGDITGINKNILNIRTILDTIYNDLPKVTGEGTEVTLTPTRKGRLALIPKGNSSQESTTGKQLFDIDGTLYDGTIDKVGNGFKLTKSTNRTLSMTLSNSIPAGTYKVTYVVKNNTLSALSKCSITLRSSNALVGDGVVNSNGETSITTTDTATRMYVYIYGDQADTATITLDDFMISVNGGDYEQFTGRNKCTKPKFSFSY